MKRSVSFRTEFPVSVNHYWLSNGNRRFISAAGRAFRAVVHACATDALKGQEALQGDLRVEVGVYPPDRRRRDLDNLLKSLLDALEHANVYRDDAQIAHLTIWRGQQAIGGGCHVCVEEM